MNSSQQAGLRAFYRRRAADRAANPPEPRGPVVLPPEDLTKRDPRFAELDRRIAAGERKRGSA